MCNSALMSTSMKKLLTQVALIIYPKEIEMDMIY